MGELIHEPSNKTQKTDRLSYTSFVTVQTRSGGNNGLYAELRKFGTLTVVRHSVSTFNLTHPQMIEFFNEFPYTRRKRIAGMVQGKDGLWRLTHQNGMVRYSFRCKRVKLSKIICQERKNDDV